jgi:hydroxyethylthiazole kinase-like sugar kinase family protein
MRWIVIATLVAGGLGISTPVMPAHAAGCLKGAVVGGVAGHLAGHHGVLGAGAGCVIGHHEASEEARRQQQQQVGGDIGHGSEGH